MRGDDQPFERKIFGTDGVRGMANTGALSPDQLMRLGIAAGRVFRRGQHRHRVVIGKDTRLSGYMFESALEAGFTAAGADVLLLGPLPTPGVAYLTQRFEADLGVVISASHNLYFDNGIKFFDGAGSKLTDEVEAEIESRLGDAAITVESQSLGSAKRIDSALVRYERFCASTMPEGVATGLTPQELADLVAFLQEDPADERVLGEEVVLFDGTSMASWTHHLSDSSKGFEDVWRVEDDVLKCEGRPAGYVRTKDSFEKSLQHLGTVLQGIRTGRASSALVDNIRVDYYGTPTPISQLASVTIPEARQIMIKPFDASIIKEVEKAVSKADLGAAPQDDGKVVRITLPPLSGEQREKFAHKVKDLCEEGRVSMRNVRRDMNKHADQMKKDGELTEDEHHKLLDEIQSLLKDWEKKVDAVYEKKVAEIME